jgi:hypothetical protein
MLQKLILIVSTLLLSWGGYLVLDRLLLADSSSATQVTQFQSSSHEIYLKLFLKQYQGQWQLVKTDVLTDAEQHQPESLAEFTKGFSEIDPELRSIVDPILNRYFTDRIQAVTNDNIYGLWQDFPALRQNRYPNAGINAEAEFVKSYRALKPTQADLNTETYSPWKVKVQNDRIEVLIHGIEAYHYSKK